MNTDNNANSKVLFITGCSSGIGLATSVTFAKNGYRVIGTIRNEEGEGFKELTKLINDQNLPIEILKLDLNDSAAINAILNNGIAKYGRIDVVINNAGFGYISAVEEIDLEKLKQQYQVNVYAPLLIMQKVLPVMRNQHQGLIINISSVMGFSSAALNAPYSSSKHALANISETTAIEANKFGIKVVVIEPGKTNTKFMSNVSSKEQGVNSPYKQLYDRSKNKHDPSGGNDPQNVADLLFKLTTTAVNGKHYTVGKDAFIRKYLKYFMPNFVWVEFMKFFYKWK